MKAVKILSIIGIVLFSVCLLGVIGMESEKDFEAAFGAGCLATLYGLGYSITALVLSKKSITSNINDNELIKPIEPEEKQIRNEFNQSSKVNSQIQSAQLGELEKFAALKEKGLITTEDYEAKKKQFLGL